MGLNHANNQSMTISDDDVLRRPVAIRNPFAVRRLSLLSHLHKAAFKVRRRLSRRFVGKPAKRLYRLLLRLGAAGKGSSFAIALPGAAAREVGFNGRNTQFGALYLPQNQPIYEPETSVLLDCLVADGDVFFDVGANWGWYALLIASRPGFSGRVHAFEPFPETFQDLARCVGDSALGEIVTCHEVALADSDGDSAMGFSDGVQSGLARLGEAGGTRVRIARLDSLFLPAPAVIKIDAEDHELAVLAGAAETIAASRPFIVFESWLHRDDPRLTLAPMEFLVERDYRFFYAGWAVGDPHCVLPSDKAPAGNMGTLALVPFLTAQRFHLPDQLNILAVPAERMADLRGRLTA